MALQDLSSNAQDYLKMIWDLLEWGRTSVQPSDLARKAQVRPSTVTGAVARLVAGGYAQHDPYGAIELTEQGRRYAVHMVRKHRLLETFLVSILRYGWDEVHTEADALEHAASDLMIDRIDDLLGHPDTDPHGDPIPRRDGSLPHIPTITLADAAPGVPVRIERVSDEDPELLRTLNAHDIALHSTIQKCAANQDDTTRPTQTPTHTAATTTIGVRLISGNAKPETATHGNATHEANKPGNAISHNITHEAATSETAEPGRAKATQHQSMHAVLRLSPEDAMHIRVSTHANGQYA